MDEDRARTIESADGELHETLAAIAEGIRSTPFHTVTNNCLKKSFRFRRECRRLGIPARVVICFGLTPAMVGKLGVVSPSVHAWGEADGQRIEVARPPDEASVFGFPDSAIKPVFAVWI